MTSSLRKALARAAKTHTLLVAVDFDGTLSEIVDDPDQAEPVPGAIEVLDRLASEDGVVVALVSGRRRSELAERAGAPEAVILVGGHGVEMDEATPTHPDLEQVAEAVDETVSRLGAPRVERKRATVTVHTRSLPEETATEVIDRVSELGQRLGHRVETGKAVVEIHLSATTKGTALEQLRQRHRVEHVIYVGDDTTDEEAFGVLRPDDLGIKVGPGPTRAAHRLDSPEQVVEALRLLADVRREASSGGGGSLEPQ